MQWRIHIKGLFFLSSPGVTGKWILDFEVFFHPISVFPFTPWSFFDPFSVSLLLMLSFSSLTYLFVSILHFLSLGLSWRVQRRRSQPPCLCATSASACWCVQWEAVSSWGWTLASDMAASWQFSHLLVSKHKNVQKWTHCQLSLGFASQCIKSILMYLHK